mgnify:CR=1 FL=1
MGEKCVSSTDGKAVCVCAEHRRKGCMCVCGLSSEGLCVCVDYLLMGCVCVCVPTTY